MTNTEAMREHFEAHMRREAPNYTQKELLGKVANGSYSSLIVDLCWKTWVASGRQTRSGAPEGWALVPVIPTDKMRDAGNIHTLSRGALFAAWRAMLAAAPRATEAGTESAEPVDKTSNLQGQLVDKTRDLQGQSAPVDGGGDV